ncbi:MAG: hypothetical protein ACE5F1_04535 [Planctomycetota bacterium]
MRNRDRIERRPVSILASRDGLRIWVLILATLVLGAMVMSGLLSDDKTKDATPRKPVIQVEVPIPHLDLDLIKQAKDENPIQRLSIESEIYTHLLVFANKLVPAALKLMGLGHVAVPELQKHPERYRGQPLWYEGHVEQLSDPVEIKSLYKTYRTVGLLETLQGDKIKFAVVEPLPEGIKQGSFARIEGIFFKLIDEQFPKEIRKVPFLVGANLRRAFEGFEPVKELDPKILSLARDETEEEMNEIETIPLYHLSSYVRNLPADGKWREELPSLTREEATKLVKNHPDYPRGSAFKILASLFWVRNIAAEPNPLGNEWWTDVWVDHPTVGTIALRIPKKVGGTWKTGDYVVLYGHYLKKHRYEVGSQGTWNIQGQGSITQTQRFNIVPYFVAGDLFRWELVEHPSDPLLRISLATIAALLIGLLCLLVFRDSKADKAAMARILERRKRRRQAHQRQPG